MTKDRILQTAASMFSQRGLRSVSIDALCHVLGISKKTYYAFFANKDALVEYFVEVSLAELFQALRYEQTHPDPITRLTRFDAHIIAFFRTFTPS